MTVKYAFECWEIDFPDDCDGEPTRGISETQAKGMTAAGLIELVSVSTVTNSYGERVLSHLYTPCEDKEPDAWEAMCDGEYDDEEST